MPRGHSPALLVIASLALPGKPVWKVTHMSRIPNPSKVSTSPAELPRDLAAWLESQNLERLPTLTKDGALKFLNDRGMPVRRNAVVQAFNSKELVSAIYSGKRLASAHEVMKWAISRLGEPI